MAAFVPPQPSSYYCENECLIWSASKQRLQASHCKYKVILMKSKRGNIIPTVLFLGGDNDVIMTGEEKMTPLLLFAHGNATDLGHSFHSMSWLAASLKINVLAFDYEGYGPITKERIQPTVKFSQENIDMVYDYAVRNRICVQPEMNMILYGQSLGSVFVCKLASVRPVAGVILHSPLASGAKLLVDDPPCWLNLFEVFPNEKRIRKVKCPVFVIHGMKDSQIPVEHGMIIHEAVPEQFSYPPFWATLADHNDVENLHDEEYYSKVNEFVQFCLRQPQTDDNHSPIQESANLPESAQLSIE
jgi:pimeloyl-ACP methyl ester carboxylesterase